MLAEASAADVEALQGAVEAERRGERLAGRRAEARVVRERERDEHLVLLQQLGEDDAARLAEALCMRKRGGCE